MPWHRDGQGMPQRAHCPSFSNRSAASTARRRLEGEQLAHRAPAPASSGPDPFECPSN
ncbi:hypothetical protein GCM10010215_26160 [Streptomyces virginiae]|uniref:Integrase n=1 Tax=Streptomyces virginiae TaxID=1961 RepID=A0ABQ3NN63_STRVG|nr:hypothetical protein GCM10010215_26160 [Streptomyces virginiae]GHI14205.1 hypothetical protein Scinn_36680 [Streptomyces virginiae]